MCASEGFPPDISWRPGTWSKSGGGRWSRKGFPGNVIRSCLCSRRIPQDISLLPLMGCRRLCSDATLFLSGWFGRRCGIDAGIWKQINAWHISLANVNNAMLIAISVIVKIKEPATWRMCSHCRKVRKWPQCHQMADAQAPTWSLVTGQNVNGS